MRCDFNPHVTTVYGDDGRVIIQAPSNIVAQAYFSGSSIELGLLPPAVRWVSTDGLGLVVERPPESRRVSYKDDVFDIHVPWTIWGIRFKPNCTVESSYLFARPYPLSTVEDELFAFPLPNMGTDSSIALPSVNTVEIGPALLPIIKKYWTRPFTGVHNEMLDDLNYVPDEWVPHLEEGLSKYFVFLGEHDIESITFAPFKVAQIPSLNALCTLLDPLLQEDAPQTTLEYFKDIVTRASTMAGI